MLPLPGNALCTAKRMLHKTGLEIPVCLCKAGIEKSVKLCGKERKSVVETE